MEEFKEELTEMLLIVTRLGIPLIILFWVGLMIRFRNRSDKDIKSERR